MTHKEILMYQIICTLSASDAPFVFKGALITKLALAENGYTALERHTRDIDANWIGTRPSMEEIVDSINRSLGDLREKYHAVPFRDYSEKMTAGIAICDKETNDEIASMDIDMRPVAGSKDYRYGDIHIRGVEVNDIIADKITVLSKKIIFRRAKDIIDVYALAHCIDIHSSEIFEKIESNANRDLGDFTEFITRRPDLEHAYSKLMGVDGKPAFDDVYSYLTAFLRPFVEKDMKPRTWHSGKTMWEAVSREKRPMADVMCDAKAKSALLEQEQRDHQTRTRPESIRGHPRRAVHPCSQRIE